MCTRVLGWATCYRDEAVEIDKRAVRVETRAVEMREGSIEVGGAVETMKEPLYSAR